MQNVGYGARVDRFADAEWIVVSFEAIPPQKGTPSGSNSLVYVELINDAVNALSEQDLPTVNWSCDGEEFAVSMETLGGKTSGVFRLLGDEYSNVWIGDGSDVLFGVRGFHPHPDGGEVFTWAGVKTNFGYFSFRVVFKKNGR